MSEPLMMKTGKALVLFLLLQAPSFFFSFTQPFPDPDTLEKEGAIIGKIFFERVDVFDTREEGENKKLFRLVNLLHLETHEAVIRRELLFKEGDRYVKSFVEESARKLRRLPYLYTARIDPVSYHDGIIDLKVYTQDAWTTKPSISIGRKGGVNTYKLSLEDDNFLGFGKEVSAQKFKGIENSGVLFEYIDHQFLGSRWNFGSDYVNNTDGKIMDLYIGQPFYSLDTRWSFDLEASNEDQIKRLYHQEEISNKFREKLSAFTVTYGHSSGLRNSVAQRFYLFFDYDDKNFSNSDDPSYPSLPPEDRTISAIGFSFQRINDSFIKVRRFNNFGKIEDFKTGNELLASIGIASSVIGSTRNGLMIGIADSQGFRLSESGLIFLNGEYETRIESGTLRNAIFSFSEDYFNSRFKSQTFFVRLAGDIGKNLDPENQFLLGGDTGLRGYPVRFLDGSRRLLLSIEDRIFTDLEIFHLFYLGMAVFFDSGLAWNHSNEFRVSAFRKDVGFGFRIGNRRSSLASIVHVDIAYPLNPVRGERKLQLVVLSTGTF